MKDFSQYFPLFLVLNKTHQDCHDICHQIWWFTKTVTKFGEKNHTLLITKHPSVPSSIDPGLAPLDWKFTGESSYHNNNHHQYHHYLDNQHDNSIFKEENSILTKYPKHLLRFRWMAKCCGPLQQHLCNWLVFGGFS